MDFYLPFLNLMSLYNSVTQNIDDDRPTQRRKSKRFTGSKEKNEDKGVSMMTICINTEIASA